MEVGTDEFGKMYQMYFDDVLRAVYHRISDRQTAEDITQDTFVAAFKLGEGFLAHPKPKLWLLRTARNKLREQYRRARRWGMEPLEECLELAAQDCRYGEVELDLEVRMKDGDTGFVNTLGDMEGVRSAVLVSYNGDYMG